MSYNVVPLKSLYNLDQIEVNFWKINNIFWHLTSKQYTKTHCLISEDFALEILFQKYDMIVEQLQGGTLRPPQDPPRLVPKCAPGCIFWYFWCSQENNIGEIWVSDQFCTTAWWKNEHIWDEGWGHLTLHKNQTVQPIYTYTVSA